MVTDQQKIGIKIGLGFIYSLVTTYFVIYKLIIEDFYQVKPGGGDWEYLAIILGWPIYTIVSSPLLVVFYKKFKTTQNSRLKFLCLLTISPTLIGLTLLLFVTLTGRFMYQPIYEQKKLQIQKNVVVKPLTIVDQGFIYDPQCKCTRKRVAISFDITNDVNFPIYLEVNPSYVGECQFNLNLIHYLRKGSESLQFQCFFDNNVYPTMGNLPQDITYKLSFEEDKNAGVHIDKTYPESDFKKNNQFIKRE